MRSRTCDPAMPMSGGARGYRGARVAVGALAVAYLLGCGESPDTDRDAKPGTPLPEEQSDGPVRLSYVCGNRFLITNAYSVPVSVTYRILGSEEDGTADLSAAPAEDPAFSERLIETRTRGAVQLFLDGKLVASGTNEGTPCTPATPAPAMLSASTGSAGQWTAPFAWPVVAVHLSLLPSGKVLSWGHAGVPQVWDPATGLFTPIPSPVLLFCAGHSFLSDGRLLVAGGHIADNRGLPDITIFGTGSTWSSSTPMQRGRWYPTNTTMGYGQVVITAGKDRDALEVTVPEVWTTSGIRRLTTASLSLPYYPRVFLAPNGKLYYAGETQTTRYLDIAGSGSWSTGPRRLYGARDYGAAVLYDEGRILYVGGGHTTNTAEIVDLRQSSPVWRWTGSMAYPRRHHNAVILPTGEVLVVGGLSGTLFNDLTTAVHPAEIWSPATGAWRTLASNTINRGYHTTAILLPDGRVLLSGSGDGAGAPSERNAEIFSPPYLFAGARPAIGTAPSTVSYGIAFRVNSPDAPSIAKVSLIRLGSTTHAFDMNQRFQKLSFTSDASGLNVTAPSNRNRTPPGHYMLFIVNTSGVPSVAKIVQVK
jgi:galactose oxidase-like protein